MTKILIVSSDFPYPANHGGRVDIWGRIKKLSSLGYKIDLICTTSPEATPTVNDKEVVQKYVEKITCIQRDFKVRNLLSIAPYQMTSRGSLSKINIEEDYDIVLLEGEYTYPVLKAMKSDRAKVYLRVHNDELVYLKSLKNSEKKWLKKIYFLSEMVKFSLISKSVNKKIENYLFISNKEKMQFDLKYKDKKTYFLPPPTGDKFHLRKLDTKKVVFIGSLFMTNNKEAIEWYIEKVHPLVKRSNSEYEFIVAGNSRNNSIDWLIKLAKHDNCITIHDSPESLDDIYEQGRVFVNPMLNGAGVKLKTIEAIMNGLPVVSTTIGNEGTGLINDTHLIVRDEEKAYADAINELLGSKELSQNYVDRSQEFIKENYNQEELLLKYIR
ncbi:hypothetical protein CHH91_00035 [Virgibacillus sp. 7505]|uniref:glycosyltransferase family 4 protein n=1 Tax=Virgibacillus sp. 7505 TaxID=2022548 RepID=UPI000BA67F49|nr:glycosyltransferase family 4 protein [Virgibacillus sp. 7505]PAE17931.1 hypothetical protein CHH91_00035 [Virgibacillus sp. 7505]